MSKYYYLPLESLLQTGKLKQVIVSHNLSQKISLSFYNVDWTATQNIFFVNSLKLGLKVYSQKEMLTVMGSNVPQTP